MLSQLRGCCPQSVKEPGNKGPPMSFRWFDCLDSNLDLPSVLARQQYRTNCQSVTICCVAGTLVVLNVHSEKLLLCRSHAAPICWAACQSEAFPHPLSKSMSFSRRVLPLLPSRRHRWMPPQHRLDCSAQPPFLIHLRRSCCEQCHRLPL